MDKHDEQYLQEQEMIDRSIERDIITGRWVGGIAAATIMLLCLAILF